MTSHTERDLEHLNRAVRFALEAEACGNLPIGAVVVLGGEVIAGAGNAVLVPFYHPGRHAEIEALKLVAPSLWPRSREMTCYTTLEPCVMCAGAFLLHGLSRVVFGSLDTVGGAGGTLAHLPAYYTGGAGVPRWVGPLAPDVCDPLFKRALARFDALPCGRNHF